MYYCVSQMDSLCDYEQLRASNIKENERMLLELGIKKGKMKIL